LLSDSDYCENNTGESQVSFLYYYRLSVLSSTGFYFYPFLSFLLLLLILFLMNLIIPKPLFFLLGESISGLGNVLDVAGFLFYDLLLSEALSCWDKGTFCGI